MGNISIAAVAYWIWRKNQPSSFPWPDIAYLSGPRIPIVVVVSAYLYRVVLDSVGTTGRRRARARIGTARGSPGSDRLNMRAPRARPHPPQLRCRLLEGHLPRGEKMRFHLDRDSLSPSERPSKIPDVKTKNAEGEKRQIHITRNIIIY